MKEAVEGLLQELSPEEVIVCGALIKKGHWGKWDEEQREVLPQAIQDILNVAEDQYDESVKLHALQQKVNAHMVHMYSKISKAELCDYAKEVIKPSAICLTEARLEHIALETYYRWNGIIQQYAAEQIQKPIEKESAYKKRYEESKQEDEDVFRK